MEDFDLDLEYVEGEDHDKVEEVVYESISEKALVPKEGNYLGLDISQNSTGVCLYKDGKKFTYNYSVFYDDKNPHAESSIRKQLKGFLLEVIGGNELNLIVIEDVFEGNNPEVVRKLYALNTAIDDLILDGLVVCKDFVRVQNGTWKKWLSVVDTENKYKGYKDKEKVQGYLNILGVSEEGEGFQDRLDATGMLLGYFLKSINSSSSCEEGTKKENRLKIAFSDVVCDYELDPDLVLMEAAYGMEDVNVVYIDDARISKKKILEYLSSDFTAIYITRNPIRLGLLADTLNLSLIEDGGYFGFWLSEKSKIKYKKKYDKLINE